MDYYALAGQAITTVVARMHPEDEYNWAPRKPMSVADGWGLSLAQWSTELRMIQTAFHALLAGKTITIPKSAVVNSGSKALDNFRVYLAKKAEHEG